MLWEHEVVGSNPTAPTILREAIGPARIVGACARSLTHVEVRSRTVLGAALRSNPLALRTVLAEPDSAGLADRSR